MAASKLGLFRFSWWTVNLLLVVSAAGLLYSGVWEFSVRRYLNGFSDAIVPNSAPPVQRVEAILEWMRFNTTRMVAPDPSTLDSRNPEVTLGYRQLLAVCGSATSAFLNLARSSDLKVRRLLLLSPNRRAKHVVAEVLIDGRWVIVDPLYRTLMRNRQGHLLTRSELRDPALLAEATRSIPNYSSEYTYESSAHVRLARLPLEGLKLRALLDRIYPAWDELIDWNLVLERESATALVLSASFTCLFLLSRAALARYADQHLHVLRTHLREKAMRLGVALFTGAEFK